MAGGRGKTLLLSGSLPGIGHVGEIILGDVVRRAGTERFSCVGLVSPKYRWQPDPRLDDLETRIFKTDQLRGKRWGRGRWGAVGSLLNYSTGFRSEVVRLEREIAEHAKSAQVDRIFAVLNNPMTFALAHRLAARLRVPLVTLVWDPPVYLLQLARFDRWSRRVLMREFRRTLASSQRLAVISETMQRDYAAYTPAPIQILRHGLAMPAADADATTAGTAPGDEWVIGFAGSMYSDCAWKAFLKALDRADWRLAGRPVRLRLMTARIEVASRRPASIDYLGFRSPEEVQRILAGCHLSYLPQPFVPHLRDLCRYSFPTKLTNYLTLGRPVFVHAPREGALSEFFEANPIGARATSLEPGPIIAALEGLLGDPVAYLAACVNVGAVARAHFEQSVFHAAVDSLLGAA